MPRLFQKRYSIDDVFPSMQGFESTPGDPDSNNFFDGIGPGTIASGDMVANIEQKAGVLYNGKTAFDNTAAGYRLGPDIDASDVLKFYIGDSSNYLNWTGTALNISGSITATTGTIGGWSITSTTLQDAAGVVGMSSAVTGGDDIRFWAGDATPGSAEFRVTEAGALTATSATITGSVTATSGAIGGWSITSTTIQDTAGVVGMSSAVTGGDDIRFWAGDTTPASAEFRVTESGALTATSATISGSITATSGTIGGFSIGSDYIRDAADSMGMASTVTGGDDVRFWAGDTFANRATADFRVTEAGAVTASSMTITGGAITGTPIASIPNNTSTDISLLEKTWTMVFSVTDANTIAWSAGTITLSNGRTFTISGGDTGNMSALTWIYLDPAVSSTVLQTTTTAATAMGANKILIGTAQNNTVTASFIPYGPGQPLVDGANIGALSVVAANIGNLAVTNAKINDMAVSKLTAGTIASQSIVLGITAGTGDVEIRSGIATGDFANTGAATGFIIGLDDSDSDQVKFYFGSSTEYIKFDPVGGLEVVGGVTVDEIHIGGDDATSAHIDTAGNQHWGAGNSGFSTAPASVSNAGAAIFKSIQVGGSTRQYTLGDDGIFSFGDGSDGDVTISVDTTLASDKYYDDLVINTGITLTTGGYRIFARTVTINGTGKIVRNGNNGTAGQSGTAGGAGGAGGTALADGYLKGSVAGGDGGKGDTATNPVAGTNGTATSNSIGSNGVAGGTGGNGSVTSGAAGGTGGTATASNVKLIANWHLATLLDVGSTGATVKFDNSAGSAGGGGGGGPNNGTRKGGGGGGAGSGGGIVAIYAKSITVGASASITATGGNGGNGGDGEGGGANTGGGGGGAGGNGGQVILVYNSLTNNGTITANGGTGGTGGAAGASGTAGANGTNGTAGNVRQFQLSL